MHNAHVPESWKKCCVLLSTRRTRAWYMAHQPRYHTPRPFMSYVATYTSMPAHTNVVSVYVNQWPDISWHVDTCMHAVCMRKVFRCWPSLWLRSNALLLIAQSHTQAFFFIKKK